MNLLNEVPNSRTLTVPAMPEDSPSLRRSKRRRGLDPDEDSSEVEIVNPPPRSADKVLLGPVRRLISLLFLKKIYIFFNSQENIAELSTSLIRMTNRSSALLDFVTAHPPLQVHRAWRREKAVPTLPNVADVHPRSVSILFFKFFLLFDLSWL